MACRFVAAVTATAKMCIGENFSLTIYTVYIGRLKRENSLDRRGNVKMFNTGEDQFKKFKD